MNQFQIIRILLLGGLILFPVSGWAPHSRSVPYICHNQFTSQGSSVLLQLTPYRIRNMVSERINDLIQQASPGDIKRLTPEVTRALLVKASPLMQKKVVQALDFNQRQNLTRRLSPEEKQEIERIICGRSPSRASPYRTGDRGCDELTKIGVGILLLGIFSG